MQASLALARGTLFVGVHAKTARVHSFDLGGRPLGPSFSFRDAQVGRSAAAGLALDEDHRLWVADTPADRVRIFSLFGREVGGIGAPGVPGAESAILPGLVFRPTDVEVQGNRDQGWVAIACGGEQRHAVQIFEPGLEWRASCTSLGETQRPFGGVCRLAARGELLYVAESLARAVQVFRAGAFHFAFHLTGRGGERLEPSALAALDDGRIVVGSRAPHSGLFLLDSSGRALRTLAGEGAAEGAVQEPSDVVIERGADDRHARLYVIDCDGLRVQAFTLEGRCLGTISLGDSLGDSPRGSPEGAATRLDAGTRVEKEGGR